MSETTWKAYRWNVGHQKCAPSHDEVLLVDPSERTVTWLALRDGECQPVGRCGLIDLGPTELAEQLDWP